MSIEQPDRNSVAPDFTLFDHEARSWKLSEQLEPNRKLVLVFNRGDW